MSLFRSSLLLLPLIAILTGCASAGKTLAGGEGDPNIYYLVPAVASPPLILGTRAVVCENIEVSPIGSGFDAVRQDRFQALEDSHTVTISAGPTSGTRFLDGEWLDPRINDRILLRDRGGQRWSGTLGEGVDSVNVTIVTDAAGVPLTYIISRLATSVFNTPISTQRTFGMGYGVPALGNDAGLHVAQCIVETGDFAPARPMNPGNYANVIINAIGVAQWEQDTFSQHYYNDPIPPPKIRAQFTSFNNTDVPSNVEYEDRLWSPPVVPQYMYSGWREENEHSVGALAQAYAWADGIGIVPNRRIFPVSSVGTWRGDAVGVFGVYQDFPYYLRDAPVNNNEISFTVSDNTLEIILTAGTVTMPLKIYRLEDDFLYAVRRIDDFTWEAFTLERLVAPGATTLTAASCRMTVQLQNRNFSTGAVVTLAGYSVNPLTRF